MLNAEITVFNAKSIIYNAEITVFNAKSIISNAEITVFKSKADTWTVDDRRSRGESLPLQKSFIFNRRIFILCAKSSFSIEESSFLLKASFEESPFYVENLHLM